ncbi:copper resistance protein B [Simiduia agarivorans]|uniref:Copper resistant protein PcoB n=1 Tax=Simiduia agarivorans (strain DSM 21679 / JCM 13881 / BCRC 17597 / SA1) TaxID=1117647 RepID=K4KL63_SIMAS|nr:copper resistance protein B [Simiduia agarivorans]AFU99899.1 copper resistant protein PcoB [Simiduia agarivorans SA1 = DSM 21679]
MKYSLVATACLLPALALADDIEFSGEFDQFELRSQGLALWDAELFIGNAADQALVIKSTAEIPNRYLGAHEAQVLGQMAANDTWTLRAGVRSDHYPDPKRHWGVLSALAESDAGTAYEITGFVSPDNQGLLLGIEHFWEVAPQWKLIPKAELLFHTEDDIETATGEGLSYAEVGLRLRYVASPWFKPYVGINWITSHGNTRDFLEQEGARKQNFTYRAGFTWAF